MLPSNKTLYVRVSSLIGMDRFFEDHRLDGARHYANRSGTISPCTVWQTRYVGADC